MRVTVRSHASAGIDSLRARPEVDPAEVGAEVRCTLTSEETTYGLTVTVTSIEDDQVLFDIVVDDQPQD